MEIIVFEKESFYKLVDELTERIVRNVERRYKEQEWINEVEAKSLLGIKSRSKLRELREQLMIEFSQFGKIIRYSRSSILRFLEERRVRLR
ncbi:MAG: hypothetical protein HWE22_10435 [Flavobacteriales bacterium]|nr:hypothetical protein [Flavobacteriales bacterium]